MVAVASGTRRGAGRSAPAKTGWCAVEGVDPGGYPESPSPRSGSRWAHLGVRASKGEFWWPCRTQTTARASKGRFSASSGGPITHFSMHSTLNPFPTPLITVFLMQEPRSEPRTAQCRGVPGGESRCGSSSPGRPTRFRDATCDWLIGTTPLGLGSPPSVWCRSLR